MEWMACLQKTIRYMEQHLLEDIHPEDIAEAVHVSPFYLQKGFSILTGYSLMEYVRNRRLYLAALEAVDSETKIIDLAFKYGYQTPESFTKAFYRFHGITPNRIRAHAEHICPFLPLNIRITIQGGIEMDYVIEHMDSFQVVGLKKEVQYEHAYQEIPQFWKEFQEQYCHGHTACMQSIPDIGRFGVCIDDEGKEGCFQCMIAGTYQGMEVPAQMHVLTIPELTWAKFTCVGPLPGALQAVNTKIFSEWLPENQEYDIAANLNIEWYTLDADCDGADYRSEIWIPVKRKTEKE